MGDLLACPTCGLEMLYPQQHDSGCPEVIEVVVMPEEWLHLHGKSISGHRHSHVLRQGESRDEPDHYHDDSPDGPAFYWRPTGGHE